MPSGQRHGRARDLAQRVYLPDLGQLRPLVAGHAVAVPVLTVGIAATGVLLYRRGPWPWLESAGRLALSNYRVRSAVFGTVFYSYGFGMFGRVGAATGVGLSVTWFTVQLIVSRWWSDRIGAGPVERVLRWMTYGRRP